ncbi:MAG: hypothetical protein ACOYOV_00795 [Bacteroidales bacterium]
MKRVIQDYSMFSVDPDYCYLFNGLNLAHRNFPWHIDHPGTPLQILSAIVIRLVHLFRNDSLDMDLFKNPELYIYAINYTIIYLQAFVLFFTGLIVFRFTKDLVTALFIQISPLAAFSLMIQNRIIVEQMELIASLLLISAVFWYLYTQKIEQYRHFITKYVVVFSVIIGFGIANKILFIPLFLIPFILLPNLKQKLSFTVLSLLSFSIFAFPIFYRWREFYYWIKKLFIYSGQYGGGAKNVVDKHVFLSNIAEVFHSGFLFPGIVVLSIVACMVYQIPRIKIRFRNPLLYKALLGSTLATLMLIVITCKQYKYVYLVPVLLLMVFELYLIVKLFLHAFAVLSKKYIKLTALLLFCMAIYGFDLHKIHAYSHSNIERHQLFLESKAEILQSFNNQPKLMIADYYGAPYPEYALYFGTAWSGEKMRGYYANALYKLYPDSYIYQNWDRLFYSWGNTSFSFYELLRKYPLFYLFSGDQNMENSLSSKLHGLNRSYDTQYKVVYKNEKTNECIYEVKLDTAKARQNYTFSCDAETLDTVSGNFTNALNQTFDNGKFQSRDHAFSGKHSLKLTNENPYGFTCYISEVNENETYTISVWVYNNKNNNANLVISAKEVDVLYTSQCKPMCNSKDWYKLEINVKIPEKMNSKDLKIYCWNKDKSLPAYFDDLEIIKKKQ